jgi:subtilisin family serine protease
LRRGGANGFEVAPFSNSRPVLVALGVGILSAGFNSDDALTFKSGTSMAGPHVAGLAALWWDAVNSSGDPVRASVVGAKLRSSCQIRPILNPDLASRTGGAEFRSPPPRTVS